MQNRSKDIALTKATGYVLTFPPSEKNPDGHTSLFIQSVNGEEVGISFYPSNLPKDRAEREKFYGFQPTPGFVATLDQDSRIQGNPPSSVERIENLDFNETKKACDLFNQQVGEKKHLFSSNANNLINPLNYTLYPKNNEPSPVPPFLPSDPFSPLEEVSMNNNHPSDFVTVGNCTDAVVRSLKAGGFKEAPKSFMGSFFSIFKFSPVTPLELQHTLNHSGAKEVRNDDNLPDQIKNVIAEGSLYAAFNQSQNIKKKLKKSPTLPDDNANIFIRPPG